MDHIPIMAPEWLSFLEGKHLTSYLDGTLGAGGHAEAVLAAHPEIERFYAIDQDEHALSLGKKRLEKWEQKIVWMRENFSEMGELNLPLLDGILLDIGVSSMQLDIAERGFSFRLEGPLDMRMDNRGELTAEEIVNTWGEHELGRIFRDYGEEKFWRKAAYAIVRERGKGRIRTTSDLATVLEKAIPQKKKGIHAATKVFQALRIAVNGELEALEKVLPAAIACLRPGGIFGIITFHSLEDRLVKNFFRDEASTKESTSGLAGLFLDKEATVQLLTRKPVTPSDEEVEANPRSRSAKLRVVEKVL
jgi:16S rRNA (cytosine1402-N4)-methyltransferase